MSVQTFNDVKDHDRSLIRKILEMAIFVRPYSADSTPITSIWTPAAGLTIPSGFKSVGLTTKDEGTTWTRNQETSDTTSHGYAQPTRRDILSDVSGVNFIGQESNRTNMELYHDMDLSGVTAGPNGFYFDKPSRPTSRRWEVLGLGKDGDGPDAIYVARILPEAQVTEMSDQSWQEGQELRYPCTLTGYVHEGWGTSLRELWGGPGLDAEAMGFTTTP